MSNAHVSEVPLPSHRYYKGDRVQFLFKGESHHGTVRSVTSGGTRLSVVVDPPLSGVVRADARNFRPSTVPAPAPEPPKFRFALGDRVQYVANKRTGELKHGKITSLRGDRLTAVLDGGTEKVSGHISLFEPSSIPAAPELRSGDDQLDRYAVIAYKESPRFSRETTAYAAIVTFDGKPRIEALNDGGGGCDEYRSLNGRRIEVDALTSTCARWAGRHGVDFEPVARFIDWYANHRPFGVSPASYLEQYRPEPELTLVPLSEVVEFTKPAVVDAAICPHGVYGTEICEACDDDTSAHDADCTCECHEQGYICARCDNSAPAELYDIVGEDGDAIEEGFPSRKVAEEYIAAEVSVWCQVVRR